MYFSKSSFTEERSPQVTGRTAPETSKFIHRVKFIAPLPLFILQSTLLALLFISWEDVLCTNVLPSRQRTSQEWEQTFGAHTIHGLGFGREEREGLRHPDELNDRILSYNEVMLTHRQERVRRWRGSVSTAMDQQQAISTVLECLKCVTRLKGLADDYQWESVRLQLVSEPLTQLEPAASFLRRSIDAPLIRESGEGIVGFDWGSCAWRHCGALADAQEALDELQFMLGVLEPYEAVFCLDIVERSLRDILVSIPWNEARVEDAMSWRDYPAYQPRVTYDPEDGEDGEGKIDEEYFKALQEFKVD
ncbi:hypothetical protein FisN_5Hh495 [Fistulifera solaris]|jgi:hypothetical protein|uniref:Uncharacterized protein n=1 Tax=Fistulifera solaris TaxID=1519565 RepID=A0A1Z5JT38_FISSO|nr:hypothetical protein FisN_5Hh495 [Fistulifera solaris]|eukprot:GAX17109.1 hypothetical protein FisN_5Hh495 [Fistulifera solaris]